MGGEYLVIEEPERDSERSVLFFVLPCTKDPSAFTCLQSEQRIESLHES